MNHAEDLDTIEVRLPIAIPLHLQACIRNTKGQSCPDGPDDLTNHGFAV